MRSTHALITGGAGDLAKVLQSSLEKSNIRTSAPARDELDVTSTESVKNYISTAGDIEMFVDDFSIQVEY